MFCVDPDLVSGLLHVLAAPRTMAYVKMPMTESRVP